MGVNRYWCVVYGCVLFVFNGCYLFVLWGCKVCVMCCVLCVVFCVVHILWECDERMYSVGLRCEGVVNCGEIDKHVCNTMSV